MKTKPRENERRDSVLIIVLILLLGFFCIIFASGWALRFAPSWKLNTSMGSNLNPGNDFLTSRPVSFIEPLDPAILTNPVWMDVFLTPGASLSFPTRTPLPTFTATSVPLPTRTPLPTQIASATNTVLVVASPTNTKATLPSPPPATATLKPTATNTPLPPADLQITKTDGVVTYIPGNTLTYTITVTNNGPSNVTGAVITDTIPAQVTTWTWTCVQNGGATGCNGIIGSNANFSDTVNLPNGASIVYTVTANTAVGATGLLTNTAMVAIPAGYADPVSANNSAIDTDTILPPADLQLTKTDGVATYIPGSTLTYTITVINNGPNNVTGAIITDNIPTQLATWTWTCVQNGGATGCNGVVGSSANFTDTVNLPNGSSIVYTVTANTAVGATGSLVNTATVALPAGNTDPAPGNNSDTDTDTILLPADLQLTKTDGVATYIAGGNVTYTITVSNLGGPRNVVNATVMDTFSTNIASATWTCSGTNGGTCAANGTGNINDNTVDLPVGASVTYMVNVVISAGASGDLVNTATVSVPAGYTDPLPLNNSATDTDTLIIPSADLQITKTDGVSTYTAGGNVTYTITASNLGGPGNVVNATVTDTFSANTNIASATWTCSGANGGTCLAGGSGNLNDNTVDLPVGASVTYTVNVVVSATASGNLINTATVSMPVGYTDPLVSNNSATDTNSPAVDLRITKNDGVATYTPGGAVLMYTIVVTNNSTFAVNGAVVTDIPPFQITNTTWTCAPGPGATCALAGAGSIIDTVDLPAGGSVIYTLNASTSASAVGALNNTATVAAPGGFTEIAPGDNSATDTDISNTTDPNIGPPDGNSFNPGPAGFITLVFSPAVVANGDVGTPDFVYYEIASPGFPTQIDMDWVKIEISSDGSTWYQVFLWQDISAPDTNTNVNLSLVGDVCQITGIPTELDNCPIPITRLYPQPTGGTGITIDVDGIVPPGSYPWMRISGVGGTDGPNIDAIQILP